MSVVLGVSGYLSKYTDKLIETRNKLETIEVNIPKLLDTGKNLDMLINEYKEMLPQGFSSRMPQEFIFWGLQSLKERFREAEIVAAEVEMQGKEILLPLTIKAPLKDYAELVNQVDHLRFMSFPFFRISAFSLLLDKVKGTASYEITGALTIPR